MSADQSTKRENNFFGELWSKYRPRLVAWLIDLMTASMLLVGFGIVHYLLKLTLSGGWIPWLVEALAKAEEIASAMIFLVFLIGSFISFGWTTYREVTRETKPEEGHNQ
jgi:hypothetical protein